MTCTTPTNVISVRRGWPTLWIYWVSHYESVWVCDAGSSQVRKGRTTEPDAAVQLTSDRALCCSTAALNRPRHVSPLFLQNGGSGQRGSSRIIQSLGTEVCQALLVAQGISRAASIVPQCPRMTHLTAYYEGDWCLPWWDNEPRHSSRKRLYALSSSCFSGANQKLVLRDGMGWSKDDARR